MSDISKWAERLGQENIERHEFCPLCGSMDFSEMDTSNFLEKWQGYSWQRCGVCGYAFQSPYPSMVAMAEYYQTEYRRDGSRNDTHGGIDYPSPKDISVQILRAQRQLKAFGQLAPPAPKRILDIGCANGRLLEECRRYWDSEVWGVEFCLADRELLDAKDIPWTGDIGEIGGRFDLVVMSHVLEHIDRPIEYLIDLRERLIEPRGHILIELPDSKMPSAFSDFHMGVYEHATIGLAMMKAGWIPRQQTQPSNGVFITIGRVP